MASQKSLGQVGSPQPCQHEVILPLGISCPLNTNWRHPRPFPSPWALELTKYLRQSLPGSARPCPSGPPPQTAQIVTIFCSASLCGGSIVCSRQACFSEEWSLHIPPCSLSFRVWQKLRSAETEICWPEGVLGPPTGVHSLIKEKMLW